MAIKKHIRLTGCSNVSWKDAIVKAIEDVSKTIHNLEKVSVLEQTACIQDNKITEYFVDLDLSFTVDLNRKDNADS